MHAKSQYVYLPTYNQAKYNSRNARKKELAKRLIDDISSRRKTT